MTCFGVTSLGAGSKGNSTAIRLGESYFIVDSGFSCRELEKRLTLRNIEPSCVKAIFVTHEHSDHLSGVPQFSNKFNIPVWMTAGTSLHTNSKKIKNINIFNGHQSFLVESLKVNPVHVPHDSREASQFVFESKNRKIGILTDIGHITPYVENQFQGCDILLLEFNHDRDMLMSGKYPVALKRRISGGLGHLNNEQAAQLLQPEWLKGLKHLVAMHLSEENNCPQIVASAIENKIKGLPIQYLIANQVEGFDWILLH